MESGLKKLWTRRRSKGLDGQPDPSIKSLRKTRSTDLKGHSISSAQNADRPIRTSAGNAFSQSGRPATTADNSLRPPSSRKVQPTLLGVSTPTTSPSRPNTSGSGSLLSAVNRAADAVNIAEQEFQASAQKYTKDYIATKPPRYVDIFSLSKPDSPKVYNEDVAERNLDLARVALDGFEPPLSPSKYQENVAARNAFPPLPGESNIEISSHSRSPGHIEQLPGGTRPMTSALSNQSLVRMTPNGRPATSEIQVQNPTVSHSRQLSDQSWGSQSQGNAWKAANQPAGSPSSNHRHTVPDTFHISSAGSPLSNRSTVTPKKQLLGAHVAQAGSHDLFRGENLRNYVLSQSELIHRRSHDRAQPIQLSTTNSVDDQSGTQPSDRSIRSPSALSNISSVKRSINLAHRTIMDLTGDDSEVFSENSPASHHSATPVVESAKADTMRKIQPTMVSETMRPDTSPQCAPPEVKALLQQQESPLSPVAEAAQSPPADGPVPTKTATEVRTNAVTFASTFSPISTLAHVEPRRSVMVESQVDKTEADFGHNHPDPREHHDRTSEEIDHMSSVPQEQKTVSKELSAVEPTRAESGLIRPKTPPNNVEPDPMSESASPAEKLGETEDIGPDIAQTKEQPLSETSDSTATPPSQSIIEMTPDSLHSIDFVDPSRAFGITTRDFATSPTKAPLESVPEDIEPSLHAKPKRPMNATPERRATSHDSGRGKYADKLVRSTPAYSSTFDEDEFAFKQAEARAALIRLQQSLDENFLTHPVPQMETQPSRLRHHSSLSDGKPVAPSSIFAQVRNVSPSPADNRLSVGTSTSSEDARPRISYHTLVTTTHANGLPDYRNSLSSAGSFDNSPRNSKGKQKFEIDLNNGPGPSIVNDDHEEKHPLPLPPPLHLNGTALYRNLNQAPVPPSPGEISLSSFPIPVSSPRQSFNPGSDSSDPVQPQITQHSHQNSAGTGRILRRQSSQRSQASSTSAFSIPYHMIPDRSSSVRDRLVREVE
ncbi:uncharacterized protein A1O9_09844 [Exophiala aquamarina CBS 119918]|uniref:Uncharacterized protein n=1 Tax=Exophiala aquamarina CBS 119918 TaxID=1182545 RepID=A0A072P1Q4_9EURO|nr:uncharacterized protein A1O9_09844 [Exophiala aquamarina CBS 119918]KEF54049.1 hypothetical protein A1O9_09844 [Exophiala aquamarina CBS 119918]